LAAATPSRRSRAPSGRVHPLLRSAPSSSPSRRARAQPRPDQLARFSPFSGGRASRPRSRRLDSAPALASDCYCSTLDGAANARAEPPPWRASRCVAAPAARAARAGFPVAGCYCSDGPSAAFAPLRGVSAPPPPRAAPRGLPARRYSHGQRPPGLLVRPAVAFPARSVISPSRPDHDSRRRVRCCRPPWRGSLTPGRSKKQEGQPAGALLLCRPADR
jgi:hypothetical protein